VAPSGKAGWHVKVPPFQKKEKIRRDTLGVHVRLLSVTELTERDNPAGEKIDAKRHAYEADGVTPSGSSTPG
jgi:hypothetical protein